MLSLAATRHRVQSCIIQILCQKNMNLRSDSHYFNLNTGHLKSRPLASKILPLERQSADPGSANRRNSETQAIEVSFVSRSSGLIIDSLGCSRVLEVKQIQPLVFEKP